MNTPWIHRPELVEIGWTLLHFIWQGAIVAAVLASALLLMRRSSAQARYVAACAALALMTVLPVATATYVWQTMPSRQPLAMVEPLPVLSPAPMTIAPAEAPRLNVPKLTPAPPAEPVPQVSWRERLEPLVPWLVVGWACGVSILSVRLVGGWVYLQQLRRRWGAPAQTEWIDRLHRIAQRVGVTRAVRLLECSRLDVPAVLGWLKPVILVPVSAMTGLSAAQWDAILAHELAHVRRHDYLVNLLQSVAETLLFYHPAVWWTSRIIRQERENCCDDIAAAACGDRVGYARALAALEDLRQSPSALAMAADGWGLLPRVRRLLGVGPGAEDRPVWPAGVALAGLSAALFLVLSAGRPAPALADESATLTVEIQAVDEAGQPVAGIEAYLINESYQADDWRKRNVQYRGPVSGNALGIVRADFEAPPTTSRGWTQLAYLRVPGRLVGTAQWWVMNEPGTVQYGGVTTRKVLMTPSASIRGTVKVPTGFNPAVARVSVAEVGARQLEPRTAGSVGLYTFDHPWPGVFGCEVKADGTFELPNMPVGGRTMIAATGRGLDEDQRWGSTDREVALSLNREAVIEGVLVYRDTQQPAAGIRLEASAPTGFVIRHGYTAVTDASGHFRLEGLPANVYTLGFPHNGWLDDWTLPVRTSIRAMEGEPVTGLKLELERGAVARGRVLVVGTGAPVATARVAVVDPEDGEVRVITSGTTDDAGAYAVRIPTGTARLYLEGAPQEYRHPAEGRHLVTVHPGQSDAEGPTFRLEKLPPAAAAAAMQERPKAKLRGRVVLTNGAPAAGVYITNNTVWDMGGEKVPVGAGGGLTNEQGWYEFEVEAGVPNQPCIRLMTYTAAETRQVVPTKDQVITLEDMIVRATPVVSQITGIVTDPAGKPLANACPNVVPVAGLVNSDEQGRIRIELRDAEAPAIVTLSKPGYEARMWNAIPPGSHDLKFVLYPTDRSPAPYGGGRDQPTPDARRLIGQKAPAFAVEQWVALSDGIPPTPARDDGKRTILMFRSGHTGPKSPLDDIQALEALAARHGAVAVVIFPSDYHEASVRAMLKDHKASAAVAVDGFAAESKYMSPSATITAYGTVPSPTVIVIDADGIVRRAQPGLDGLDDALGEPVSAVR